MDNTRRPPVTRSTGEMAASTTSPLRGGIQRSEPQVQFTSDSVTSQRSE